MTDLTDPASMLHWALAYAKHEKRPVFPCDENPGEHAKAPYTEHGHLMYSAIRLVTLREGD